MWNVHDKQFKAYMMLIQLGSCDMVLGIQWLRILGEITWNFHNMVMKFNLNGENMVLRGVMAKKMKVIERAPYERLFEDSTQSCFLQVHQTTYTTVPPILQCVGNKEVDVSEPLLCLKQQFHMVFEDPVNLPPVRGVFDHKIPVVLGVKPINIRPYRYSLN